MIFTDMNPNLTMVNLTFLSSEDIVIRLILVWHMSRLFEDLLMDFLNIPYWDFVKLVC